MEKKGFTLVELLAVIAILAILVIIALPNVLGMFNSAKEDTFITQARDVVTTAQSRYVMDTGAYTYYVSKAFPGTCTGATGTTREACTTAGGTWTYTETTCNDATAKVSELKMTGNSALNFVVKFNGKGDVIKLTVWDGTYSYTVASDTGVNVEEILKTKTDNFKSDSSVKTATCN